MVDDNLKTQGNKVISSNLDLKTYGIINLAPGTDPRSAVNKNQLGMTIQEIIIPGGKRYLEYQNIIANFKSSLWLSSYYNDGLIIKCSYNILDTTAIENLVNNTITIIEDVSKTIGNGFFGFKLEETNRIVTFQRLIQLNLLSFLLYLPWTSRERTGNNRILLPNHGLAKEVVIDAHFRKTLIFCQITFLHLFSMLIYVVSFSVTSYLYFPCHQENPNQ